MLTAYATVATAVEAMKEGAFDYIPKPFKIDELLETRRTEFGERREERDPRRAATPLVRYVEGVVPRSTGCDPVGCARRRRRSGCRISA